MKPGSAVFPCTPWRVCCFCGSRGHWVLVIDTAFSMAFVLNFHGCEEGHTASCLPSQLRQADVYELGHAVKDDAPVQSDGAPPLYGGFLRMQLYVHKSVFHALSVAANITRLRSPPYRCDSRVPGSFAETLMFGCARTSSNSSVVMRALGTSTDGM